MGVRFGLREARYGAVGVAASDRGYDTHGGTDEQTHMQITQGKKIACLTRELEATCQANKHERKNDSVHSADGMLNGSRLARTSLCPASEYTLWRTSEFMWISKNAYCMRLEEVEARVEKKGEQRQSSFPPLSSLTCLLCHTSPHGTDSRRN